MSPRLALGVAAGLTTLGLAGWLFFRHQVDRQASSRERECETSIRTIVSAIELYRTHNPRVPERLEQLIPRYLPEIPRCPKAKKDTYSESYLVYKTKYTLFCRGHHHRRENRPAFSKTQGWIRE